MYTDRDRDAILEDMLGIVRDDIDKHEGSVVHDMLAPPAEEHEMLGYALDAILENGFMDTAQAWYVDMHAAVLGIDRKPAVAATGFLAIQDRPGTPINIGTVVTAELESGIVTLQTIEYAAVPEAGEIIVPAVAIDGGETGNIPAYTVLSSTDLPNALIVNPSPFTGGVDAESDEDLKRRYELRARRPITSGNPYHYELWAREVEGISDARVTPLWDGPGTVKVTVINSDGRAPTSEQVEEVAVHINQPDKKPIGATVTVVAIKEVSVDITAELELEGGLLIEDIRESVEQSIAQYLAEAGTEVRYSQIARALLRTEGVKDYHNVQIGTDGILGVDNILVSADDVAVVGRVILT